MAKDNAITSRKLLLVEGNHERDFFQAWLKNAAIGDIQVMPIAGKTRLRENLLLLSKQSDFPNVTSLVIARDADDNPQGAFQSVCDALLSSELPCPQDAFEFTHAAALKIGIMILPDNGKIGALEELLLATVAEDPMASHARYLIENTVNVLSETGYRLPPPPHRRGKAEVHAFLATFDQPDKDPGKAALADIWPFDHEALQKIRSILEAM